jgi:hypothetical protein
MLIFLLFFFFLHLAKFDHYVKGTIFSRIVYDVLGDGIFNADG